MQFLPQLVWVMWLSISLSALCYQELSDSGLHRLPDPGSDFDIKNGALLSPILRTRVPGTEGSRAVLKHFVDFFKTNLPEWTLEFQNSSWTTPTSGGKQVPFVNLIATRDPPWAQDGEVGRLALVAHYDSKLEPEGFIGATDSAAPCAMLMYAAQAIDSALTRKWSAMSADATDHSMEPSRGVQILFLDGEEAFHTWTETDSLYGARALAETWERTFHPAMSTYHNALASISLFVLLDLLGAKNPQVPSYFKTTHWAYRAMAKLETRLRDLNLFKSSPNHPSKRREGKKKRQEREFLWEADKEDEEFGRSYVEDDHVPFMRRGVNILHLIPVPFPTVWHHLQDDGEHLDIDTVEDWAKLVTAFAAEWLELDAHFGSSALPRGLDHDDGQTPSASRRSELGAH